MIVFTTPPFVKNLFYHSIWLKQNEVDGSCNWPQSAKQSVMWSVLSISCTGGGESLDRMFFSFSYTLRTVRSALLGTSEVTISFTTMKKFLLTISMKCPADENKEKYQSRDWQLIQYWILHSNNMRTVSETVRRIADEIWGVKGLSKLLESVMRLLLFSVILTANVNICLQLDCVELNIIGLWLKIKRWKGNLINKELLKTSRLVVILRKGSPKFSNFGGGGGEGGIQRVN